MFMRITELFKAGKFSVLLPYVYFYIAGYIVPVYFYIAGMWFTLKNLKMKESGNKYIYFLYRAVTILLTFLQNSVSQ